MGKSTSRSNFSSVSNNSTRWTETLRVPFKRELGIPNVVFFKCNKTLGNSWVWHLSLHAKACYPHWRSKAGEGPWVGIGEKQGSKAYNMAQCDLAGNRVHHTRAYAAAIWVHNCCQSFPRENMFQKPPLLFIFLFSCHCYQSSSRCPILSVLVRGSGGT